VDRHRFDAKTDPNFHVDPDLDPDPDWHQNDADKFTHLTFSNSFARIVYQLFHMSGIDNDPDWYALDADPDTDPNPAK
jgi:hypothetical protein